jgi:hypothetical protein
MKNYNTADGCDQVPKSVIITIPLLMIFGILRGRQEIQERNVKAVWNMDQGIVAKNFTVCFLLTIKDS